MNNPVALSARSARAWVAALSLPLAGCSPVPADDAAQLIESAVPPVSAANVWRPGPGTSWQWQLVGPIDTSFDVDMYDVDLFDTSADVIDALHADGRIVICYFSAGTLEEWRLDVSLIPDALIGKASVWPREYWLDIRDIEGLAPVMSARLDLAAAKGCDGVEPDNVDAYINDSGFPLAETDQLRFNRWLANESHERALSVGLKNDVDQVRELEPYFDWALNERCHELGECGSLSPFIAAGKAVFGVEYHGDPAVFCPELNSLDYDWLFKSITLDSERLSCR